MIPFFKQLCLSQKSIGAIAPFSGFVAKEMVRPLYTFSGDVHVLEQGGGTGQITTYIEKTLEMLLQRGAITNYRLVVVEINHAFCDVLRKKFAANPHIHIVCQDVSEYVMPKQFDMIISSLPFTNISYETIEKIFANSLLNVKSFGCISYVEYIGMARLKMFLSLLIGRKDRETDRKIRFLKSFRKKWSAHTKIIWLNIPSTYVYRMTIGT